VLNGLATGRSAAKVAIARVSQSRITAPEYDSSGGDG
jgi:hypothetical protein